MTRATNLILDEEYLGNYYSSKVLELGKAGLVL
jgi:hypothetical protein